MPGDNDLHPLAPNALQGHGKPSAVDPLLTVGAVADHLQVSDRSVLRLIATKELRAVRIGRLWRVRPRDLEEYLKLNASR